MTGKKEDEGLAKLASWAVRDRARALGSELARPWRRGRETPEAEIGRWIGLGLALGAIALGAGLAIYSTLTEE